KDGNAHQRKFLNWAKKDTKLGNKLKAENDKKLDQFMKTEKENRLKNMMIKTAYHTEIGSAIGGLTGGVGGVAYNYYRKDKDKRDWKDAVLGGVLGSFAGSTIGGGV